MTEPAKAVSPQNHRAIHAAQNRLRFWLAGILLSATCLFALWLAWLAQTSPLQPLLEVRNSLLGLLLLYGISLGVAIIYARWIRDTRNKLLDTIRSKRDGQ